MKVLVTGGGGFIGLALVNRLVESGYDVSTFSRNLHLEHQKPEITIISGDIANYVEIEQACKGIETVFHVAAKVGIRGSYEDFYNVNVRGTKNVIDACLINKVRRLIFTSSASVVFAGTDIEGADESLPYPAHPLSHYIATKAESEQMVLNANSESLKTIALRPHLVWGPGDTQLIPRIIKRAKTGHLRRIGNRNCYIDTVHVDNLIKAQLLALKKMNENPEVCGRPFFITDGQPVLTWNFINKVIRSAGLPPVRNRVPETVAFIVAWLIEKAHHLFRWQSEPYLTCFLVMELCTHHWFDISAARNLLDYLPESYITENVLPDFQ